MLNKNMYVIARKNESEGEAIPKFGASNLRLLRACTHAALQLAMTYRYLSHNK